MDCGGRLLFEHLRGRVTIHGRRQGQDLCRLYFIQLAQPGQGSYKVARGHIILDEVHLGVEHFREQDKDPLISAIPVPI